LLAFSIDLQAQDRAGIVQHVEVKDRPVNLAVALSRGLDIGGIVEVESGQNRDQIKLDKTSVRLSTSYPDIDQANAPVNPDGTFTIKSVIPAQWHIGFSSDSVYVKSVWLGTREVPRGLVDLTLNATGAPDKLRILVSAKTATIRGTAPPEADITWSALDGPVPSRNIARADASGQFTIRGLGPGKYRLAILPDEEGGSEITVNEGETASIALKAGNAIR
jgi:hypothetical protein